MSLYVEKNSSGHIATIIKRYPDSKVSNDIYRLFDCSLLAFDSLEQQVRCPYVSEDYKVTVLDYGCLQEDNLEDFLKADISIVVSGAKEWELSEAETALRLLDGYPNIKYLFNYLDGNQFREVVKYMDKLPCFRIPYEPDPFRWKNNNFENFMNRLLEY
jgi:serine/threonine-protein kinase